MEAVYLCPEADGIFQGWYNLILLKHIPPVLKNKAYHFLYSVSHLLDPDLVSCHTLTYSHFSVCVRMGKKGFIILVIILQHSTFSVGPVQDLSLLPFCGSY